LVRADQFVYANPALVDLLGFPSRDALLAEPVSARLVAELRGAFRRGLDSVASKSGVAVRGTFRLLRRDQTNVAAELSLSRVELAGGPAVFVNARSSANARGFEARLAEKDRMASLGTLAAGVAHEINNPLSYVLGSLDLGERELRRLKATLGNAPSLAEPITAALGALDNARDGAERVRLIVRDLREFSRAEPDDHRAIDVEAVLDASVRVAWNEIRHRARLVKRYSGVAPVLGDEARLGQVFLNLIVNAAQAIDADSGQREITLSTRREPGHTVVEVSDTGTGIAAADIEHIFDPFYTTKPAGKGTGLGLAICHGIVGALGGEISVSSQPDVGTTFRVVLPVAPVLAIPAAAYVNAEPEAEAKPVPSRVLIIDDEPLLGQTMSYAFRGTHEVVVATSGRDALERLASDTRFDLVLCDLMMPDMNGSSVYEAVQRDRPELAKRFVFMTGGAFTDRAREFLAQHQGAHLEKPFNIDEVERLLGQVR
jgi:signal transduction histidine kinase